MKLPSYPPTKPSGVEWLGDVPEHWDIVALKRRFCIVNGGTPLSSKDSYWQGEIPWFTPEDLGRIETKVIATSRRKITKDGLANCGASLSPHGSVLLSTRAPIGHVAVMGVDGCCNQGCRILVPHGEKVSADFGFYVTVASNAVLNSVGKGTTFLELSAGALGAHFIPLPDPVEQRAITAFLDRETKRVDRLVAKKRELIERLKEKRTALISRTVTGGLPPAAGRAAGLPERPSLKPSGIEWIGTVPEHWEVLRFRNIVVGGVTNGLFKTQDAFGDGTRLINVYDAYRIDFNVDEQSLERVATTTAELRLYRVKSGDIFFVRSSLKLEGVGRAVCCLNPAEELVFECHLVRARPDLRRIYPRFLILYLNSQFVVHSLIAAAKTTTMATIGQSKMLDLPVLLPALPEQRAIAAYLDEETAKLDALIGKVEEAVERLQEYRTALITAAVTGKIDVRKAGQNELRPALV